MCSSAQVLFFLSSARKLVLAPHEGMIMPQCWLLHTVKKQGPLHSLQRPPEIFEVIDDVHMRDMDEAFAKEDTPLCVGSTRSGNSFYSALTLGTSPGAADVCV